MLCMHCHLCVFKYDKAAEPNRIYKNSATFPVVNYMKMEMISKMYILYTCRFFASLHS